MRLSPKEAAEKIKPELDPDIGTKLPADEQRSLAYITAVCAELGLDARNPDVFDHVTQKLDDAGIEYAAGEEYPKMLVIDKTSHVVFETAEDEALWHSTHDPKGNLMVQEPVKVPEPSKYEPESQQG